MRNKFAKFAALAVCAGFASCSEYDAGIDPMSSYEIAYEAAFIKTFGQPAADQDWGFGSASATETRSVISEINDPFVDYGNTDNLYASKLPSNAAVITDIWNYQNKYGCAILEQGKYEIGCWNTARDAYLDLYVTGDVELNSNTIHSANIYLLPGTTLTYTGNPIHNVKFYVSENATLNYTLTTLESQGWTYDAGNNNWVNGVTEAQIFNRGTVNLPENFELNQDAVFYNEGNVNGVNITSKPGDSHPSYFYNYGMLKLKGGMQLNSCSNFYNEGTVVVEGNTEFTQAGTWWINNGHYTTENINFSAKNGRVYNYCNLIVNDNLHMFDGEFNLMNGSYVEANTAEFDNFVVNMYGESGMNIKSGVTFPVGQGDGTYQGFKAVGNKAWIRFGGNTTVAEHKLTFELSGPITYAINNIIDEGANNSGVQPTYRFNSGTVEAPFESLNPIHNDKECGATWTSEEEKKEEEQEDFIPTYRIIAEDLSAESGSDFDFNDVVFDIAYSATQTKVILRAAGGTLPLRIGKRDAGVENAVEVHGALGVSETTMFNTFNPDYDFAQPLEPWDGELDPNYGIGVWVQKGGEWIELTAERGHAASKICVTTDYKWCIERQDILIPYPDFEKWVGNPNVKWY